MNSNCTDAAILARDIAAGKGKRNIFEGLSFVAPRATITAVIGANGTGKTTLLETLLGIVRLSAGSLQVCGMSPQKARSAVGYVPQTSHLRHDSYLVGREYVRAAFRGWQWGANWRWREASAAVDQALAMVDAETLAAARLAHLSGGQRQLLQVAQALVNQPRLLLMDEPLAHLDQSAKARLVGLAACLRDEHGLTVVLSTHDLDPLRHVTDQVLFLGSGQGQMRAVEYIALDSTLSPRNPIPMRRIGDRSGRTIADERNTGNSAAEKRTASFRRDQVPQ